MDAFKDMFIKTLMEAGLTPPEDNRDAVLATYRTHLDGENHETYEIAAKHIIRTLANWPKLPRCIEAINEARNSLSRSKPVEASSPTLMDEATLFATQEAQWALNQGCGNLFNEFYQRNHRIPTRDEFLREMNKKLTDGEINQIRSGKFEGKPYTEEMGRDTMIRMIDRATNEETRLITLYG